MRSSVEFLIGLLDRDDPAGITQEDFEGAHGPALRRWQERGFIQSEPGINPAPSCPHCGEGVPYQLGDRFVCSCCCSEVDPHSLLLWTLDQDAFLAWLAGELRLRGGVRRIDDSLTQLGTWEGEDGVCECFYRRSNPLSEVGRARLSAYRTILVLFGLCPPPETERRGSRCLSLLELLGPDDPVVARDLRSLLRARGAVRFDVLSGALWAGDTRLGEVPVGSKEFAFLHVLADHLDQFVPYGDLKHVVLRQAGSTDTTEEATFCHRLKNRIKQKGWIPMIDRLLVTTNKADGYRLRGYLAETEEPLIRSATDSARRKK